jgi:mRNA interferase MazF
VPFPFTDLSALKYRPAVILTPDPLGSDVIVAHLSSVIPDGSLPASNLLIANDHPEFATTGLKQTSVVRLDKLMTLSRSLVRRRLGRLGPILLASPDARLRAALGL